MDDAQFDRLTRMVAAMASRRSILHGAAAGGAGTLALLNGALFDSASLNADAKKKNKKKRKHRRKNQKKKECRSANDCKQPSNSCQESICEKHKCREANKPDGTSCGQDQVCENGSCVGACGAPGATCDAGADCCSGVCACGDPTGWAKKPDDNTCWAESYEQGFEENLDGWFDFRNQYAPTDPPNRVFSPEDTIKRVCGTEDGISASSGDCFAKVLAGVAYPPVNELTALTTFGGFSSVFPAGGFQASIDIYLDPGATEEGERFAYTVALNQPDCEWGGDFIFHVGNVGGTYCIRGGTDLDTQNGPAPCTEVEGHEPIELAPEDAGWYTFQHEFSDGAGGVQATLRVRDAGGAEIGSWELDPVIPDLEPGGNRYGWFPWNDLAFVAIDNVERTA